MSIQRLITTTAVFLGTFGHLQSRPVPYMSWEGLWSGSDLVAVLRLSDVTPTLEKPQHLGLSGSEEYQGFLALTEIVGTLKQPDRNAQPVPSTIEIPFFQRMSTVPGVSVVPGFNGAVPAPFSMRKGLLYLAFLRFDAEQKKYLPVTGIVDGGFSIKMMYEFAPSELIELPNPSKRLVEPPGQPNP